jgi:hypothetical protein
MQKNILIINMIAIAILTVNCSMKKNGTPIDLLKNILKTAQEKNYTKLEKYVYPFKYKDTQSKIISGIKENKKSSDGAYSHESLKKIIYNYTDKIEPLPKSLLNRLFLRKDKSYNKDVKLAKLAVNHPENILIFDYQGAHILIVLIDGRYQLLFWEYLTNIK